jgi:tetratricopeptide (TPR) repeat protein
MTASWPRLVASLLLPCSLLLAVPVRSATPAPKSVSGAKKDRNDYANVQFTTPLAAGLKHFYSCDYKSAEGDFERALAVIPDNTFAISFLNAAAAHQGDDLDVMINHEEDAATTFPKDYVDHIRLGFSYLFSVRDRSLDAREEFQNAENINVDAAAAHVGLGIMRDNERSANRAKVEMLAAMRADPNNVLAREYLARIYQVDLRDPQRGIAYAIDVPNLVPGYADIQFHIGSLLYDLKQDDAAIAAIRRGLDLDVCHVGEAGQFGYTLIARIYMDEKRCNDAQKALDTAVKEDTDAIYAHTLMNKLQSICAPATPGPRH